jgi:hypothetical protein
MSQRGHGSMGGNDERYARKDRLARNKAERNKRIEGKNRIARNAERDKRIGRLYYANCSGAPMKALDTKKPRTAVPATNAGEQRSAAPPRRPRQAKSSHGRQNLYQLPAG